MLGKSELSDPKSGLCQLARHYWTFQLDYKQKHGGKDLPPPPPDVEGGSFDSVIRKNTPVVDVINEMRAECPMSPGLAEEIKKEIKEARQRGALPTTAGPSRSNEMKSANKVCTCISSMIRISEINDKHAVVRLVINIDALPFLGS